LAQFSLLKIHLEGNVFAIVTASPLSQYVSDWGGMLIENTEMERKGAIFPPMRM